MSNAICGAAAAAPMMTQRDKPLRGNAMDPIVGRGKYSYKVDETWQRPPGGSR